MAYKWFFLVFIFRAIVDDPKQFTLQAHIRAYDSTVSASVPIGVQFLLKDASTQSRNKLCHLSYSYRGNEEIGGYYRGSIHTSVGYLYFGYKDFQKQAVADMISLL